MQQQRQKIQIASHEPEHAVLRFRANAGTKDEFEELCRLFGLLSPRDTERTVVRVFRYVVRQECRECDERESEREGVGSTALAEAEQLNRLTAMHHLNRMVEAGILEKHGSRYYLKEPDLEEMVNEMEREAEEAFLRARTLAERIRRNIHER